MWGRRFVAFLMALVVLGSAVMPAMAAGNEETGNYNACTGKPEFVAVDVKGLKNKEVKILREFAHKNGYKLDLSKAKVSKIYSNVGQVLVTDIPYTNSAGKFAGIIIVDDKVSKKAMMYELKTDGKTLVGGLYYVENGKVQYQPLSSGFLDCLWDCVGGLSGVAACGGSCAACAEGGFWTCLACAACLGKAGCCVGECARDEPWGSALCSAARIACVFGRLEACAVYMGCQGNCIF